MDKIERPVIPIDWIQTTIGTLPLYECPACGCYVYKKTNYCPSCGQKLGKEDAPHD